MPLANRMLWLVWKTAFDLRLERDGFCVYALGEK
jgi:hypothetical protein